MSKTRDRRITVSVAAELVDKVDEYVSKTQRTNRSEVFEQALRLWESLAQYPDKDRVLQEAMNLYEKQQERELYRAYYAELSEAARAEDRDWTELSQDSAAELWPATDTHSVHR
ncbi:MAG TPA: ribbon-helix-helix protein, CopG family [Candidatus Obscuribacterales bacterium]